MQPILTACDRVVAHVEEVVVTDLSMLMLARTRIAHVARVMRLGMPTVASACVLFFASVLTPGAEPTSGDMPAQSIDWQTSPLDLDLRGMNGERYTFLCPPGKPQPSRIVGSGPYTDDSSICTAAMHADVLRAKAGGEVTIEIRPGQDTYQGSQQNYITSGSYDRGWGGSFVVIQANTVASHAAPSH